MLEESAASGVVYSETFLSPDFCGGRDVGAWKEYLQAIREAADLAESRDGIILRGIVTPIRHFGPEKARETALCAAETAGGWIVGFGLAGDEKMFSPKNFRWSFDAAREAADIPKAEFQFRDLRATAVDETGGTKHAQALLGHTTETMTAHYIRHKVGKKVSPVR